MERPIPYKGDKGYIFISYAHRDSDRVWPIISRLQADGYRIWYDEGIDPGTEWDENIAAHISDCGYFIAMLSENFFASENCKDELNFSRDLDKPQLMIYLEEVELKGGMAMRMGRSPGVRYDQYPDKEQFYSEVYGAKDIRCFWGDNEAPELRSGSEQGPKTFRRSRGLGLVWVLVLLAAVAAGLLAFRYRKPPEELPDDTEPSEEMAAEPEETTLPPLLTNEVLLDNDQVRITALGTEWDSMYYTLNVAIENKMDRDIQLYASNGYVNGAYCNAIMPDGFYDAGETVICQFDWSLEYLAGYGIEPSEITVIEMDLGLYDAYRGRTESEDVSIVIYPQGQENAQYASYTPKEGETVLVDTEDFLVVIRKSWYDELYDSWCLDLILENRMDEDAWAHFNLDNINGIPYDMLYSWSDYVHAGRMRLVSRPWEKKDWQLFGEDKVVFCSGVVEISSEALDNKWEHSFALYPEGEEAARRAVWILDVEDVTLDENGEIQSDAYWKRLIPWRMEREMSRRELGTWYMYTGKIGEYTADYLAVWNHSDEETEAVLLCSCNGYVVEQPLLLQPGDQQICAIIRTESMGDTQPYEMLATVMTDRNRGRLNFDSFYLEIFELDVVEDQVLAPEF